jgi:outer membrane protein, heavy metal efflux system
MIKYVIISLLLISFFKGYTQTIEGYFEIAAGNNPGLQSKYKEFEAALQKVPQVNSLPDPSFSFGYFISPIETRVGPQRAKFSLSQMLPWFGTLNAQSNAASLLAESKYQSFLDERNKLYYLVSKAYYPLYELDKWKKIEEENIRILESYKAIATSRFRNGTGPLADVFRVDIMLDEAKTNLNILQKKEKPLKIVFNNLLDRNEDEEIIINDTLVVKSYISDYRKDSLLTNNPAINAMDIKIKSNEANEIAKKKQGLPKLGIGVDYAIIGKRDGIDLPDNGKDILMPMVSVTIPLYRKKYNAAVKESQLMQETFSLQKDEFINSLNSSYEKTLFTLQQQDELVGMYNRQISKSEQALNLLFSSYSNSGKDFEEVLNMEQQLLKYQKMKISAEAEFHIATAELNYLTGKRY